MASTSQNILNSLDCSICLQLLIDPKLLNCGHTFCHECIKSAVGASLTPWCIKCPNCRDETTIPEQGLSSNYVIKGK